MIRALPAADFYRAFYVTLYRMNERHDLRRHQPAANDRDRRSWQERLVDLAEGD